MRLINAVREVNAEGGGPIETVALYTEADRTAAFVREADHGYCLGPASARPYLDLAVLERALLETGADAAWAGWGFVAEDPGFAELCAKLGVTFIGPSAEAMRKLGDKIGAKLIADEAGVPVAPWSRGEVTDLDGALRAAGEVGYPLMLKASAGGGGRGIRAITSDWGTAGRLRAHAAGGRACLRQRRGLPRAAGHRGPARRGAGDCRWPRHRVGAWGAGLLGAAAQPEDHRRVRLASAERRAGRRAQGSGRAARAGRGTTWARAPSSSCTTRVSSCSPSSR